MKSWILGAVIALLTARAGFAQDDQEKKRKDILDKVQKRLEESRKTLLDKVGKIIDEELAKTGGSLGDRQKALERRLVELSQEMARIKGELIEVRWMGADEKVFNDARKAGMEPQEASDLFQEAMNDHNDKKFDAAIPSFKKVFYGFHDTKDRRLANLVCISSYNIACGYSLLNKKEEALDWLEISINRAYFAHRCSCHESAVEHMEADADLDNVRNEPRYKDFAKRGKAK